ncbi:MAG: OadG family protein [Clostridia bacterium]|nr:OadG family protein [Clostridia bacterium]
MNIYDLNTPSEIISYGVVITIEGMLVVFAILILIMLTIQAMSFFSGNKPKKVKQSKKANSQTSLVDKNTEDSNVQTDEPVVDENELIAVLTAAVAACMGTSSASVNIRSYKKVSSAWGNAAKREVLDNRF